MNGKLQNRLSRSQEAIDRALLRPVPRRPNTKDLLADFVQNPQGYDGKGRERLMEYLHETYGDAARMVEAYVMPQEEPIEEGMEVPGETGMAFGAPGGMNGGTLY